MPDFEELKTKEQLKSNHSVLNSLNQMLHTFH